MNVKALGMIALVICAVTLSGCAGGGEMSKEETKTLETNLNSPVDVEKVRAEYAASKGQGNAGAAPGGP